MDVSHDGNRLSIDGKSIELEQEVRQVLTLPDRAIVLFENRGYAETDPRTNSNIVAVDRSGRILWRIEESKPIDMDGEFSPDPFIGMGFEDNGQRVVVCDMDGLTLDLDPQTGRLSNPVFTR